MTPYVIFLLVATSVGLLVLGILELVAARPRAVSRQLLELQERERGAGPGGGAGGAGSGKAALQTFLTRVGESLKGKKRNSEPLRHLLLRAGYRAPEAVAIFWGARVTAVLACSAAAVAFGALLEASGGGMMLLLVWSAMLGWMVPMLVLRARTRRRAGELQRALPDALDLLVVCVEAGLGLNQALARMAEEIRRFSPVAADEFLLTNLEIRAGSPRAEALRHLGTRTGVDELRSLAAMLVQADRFGTSIAQALRVHADTLRQTRRQKMEELAAKSTVKLVFPLVLCIFPFLFIIILGPAILGMLRSLGTGP